MKKLDIKIYLIELRRFSKMKMQINQRKLLLLIPLMILMRFWDILREKDFGSFAIGNL
jgi:hypothetical protein